MKETVLYKFSGAGNDFVVIDGREGDVSEYREVPRIETLCREFKTDGLMILGAGDAEVDFTMEFYNPDGSGGMMCGNGGRCIVAFADYLGVKPSCSIWMACCSTRCPTMQEPGIVRWSSTDLTCQKMKPICTKDVQGLELLTS